METETLSITVSATRCHSPHEGRRSWSITVHGLPDLPHLELEAPHSTRLHDPFTTEAYKVYERWVADKYEGLVDGYKSKSLLEHQMWWWRHQPTIPTVQHFDTAESDVASASLYQESSNAFTSDSLAAPDGNAATPPRPALPSIEDYRRQLRLALHLDHLRTYERIKIYVCEEVTGEHHHTKDFSSIHSLMWELLEPYTTNTTVLTAELAAQHQKIEVHRIFTSGDPAKPLTRGLRIPGSKVRVLLLLARALQVNRALHFVDIPSVVYDTLCSLSKYLRSCGLHDRLEVDVARTGTLEDLKSCLSGAKKYDLVHLDVHGITQDPMPQLLFVQAAPDVAPLGLRVSFNRNVFEFVEVEAVAKLLKENDVRAVVLSACLSSWSQGRPLSNMCRVFAAYGIRIMTGMSFTVWNDKAEAYYASFYTALILRNYSFRDAAVQGRLSLHSRLIEQQQQKRALQGRRRRRGQPPEVTYPTITTYVAAESVVDRVDSATLGVDLDPEPQSWLYDLLVGIWTAVPFLHRLYRFTIPAAAGSLAAYASFCAARKDPDRLHTVGLMALEWYLKTHETLYIQTSLPTLSPLFEELQDIWLTTKFIDRVHIVSADKFSSGPSYLVSRLQLWSAWLRRSWRCWGKRNDSSGSKVILVIDNVDPIVQLDSKTNEPRHMTAIERMNAYINSVRKDSKAGLYVVFTGSSHAGWSELLLDVDKYYWGKAQSFLAEPGLTKMYGAGKEPPV